MKMILLGAPGAGKGTQAEIISKKYSMPIIGTGNIIREAIASGTELGNKFKALIEGGDFLPDELVMELVRDRLSQPDCKEHYILDGFPRDLNQAVKFEEMGGVIDAVISLEIADDEIIDRMTGRRVCKKCGTPYHVTHNPPAVEGVCDKCGNELIIRKDDAPETVKKRLEVYHKQTEPLIEFYEKRGVLKTIDGTQSLEDVTAAILAALEVD